MSFSCFILLNAIIFPVPTDYCFPVVILSLCNMPRESDVSDDAASKDKSRGNWINTEFLKSTDIDS